MALLTFHTIPHVKKYQSTLISKASFFTGFCYLLSIFGPFFLIFNTQGLWIKHQVHQEHPDVRFKHQALLLVRSKENTITWSTFTEYNSLVGPYLTFPSILVSILSYVFSLFLLKVIFNLYFHARRWKKTRTVMEKVMDYKWKSN